MFGQGHRGGRTKERVAAMLLQRIIRGFIGRRRSGHRRAGCRRPAPCGYRRNHCQALPPNHYRPPPRRHGGHGGR
ncbi:unnamed protein product, partial [Ectocarpus sp. 12 AP-2014]